MSRIARPCGVTSSTRFSSWRLGTVNRGSTRDSSAESGSSDRGSDVVSTISSPAGDLPSRGLGRLPDSRPHEAAMRPVMSFVASAAALWLVLE